jgi:hypothetical protein
MNSIFLEQKAVDHPEVDRISDLTRLSYAQYSSR